MNWKAEREEPPGSQTSWEFTSFGKSSLRGGQTRDTFPVKNLREGAVAASLHLSLSRAYGVCLTTALCLTEGKG